MAHNRSIEDPKSSLSNNNRSPEPIAIIGIGCRFPGGADDPEKFWQLLVNEVDAITDIPADRVDVAPYYDPIPAAPGKIASSQGGFLDRVDRFDSSFFGVSPREANYLDPQQRLLLETAWEALEDAGQVPETLRESQTGVFIGMWANDYTEKMYKAVEDINLYVTTGGGRYAASGRLSYFFGFQGPSLTVDTACSSSLVTVHLACQSLREGESTLALAGGVNLILEPSVSIGYSRSKMLSPDGRCKFGDARANGYVRSEGVGIVVLKRLSQAIEDGDPIYAVIRGSAVNNDGRSSELLVAPGIQSQVKMLREAYQNAGVNPSQVGYVEAHGTGTPVGDPVELEALSTVLSENRDASHICKVGSIKTNIGHTEAASGVAGLIKAALCLQHKAIPASLHFKEPNPKIPWSSLGLEIQTRLTPWPDSREPAFAAVNSFGITGTNAHIVLEEAPQVSKQNIDKNPPDAYLLPLSAQTPEALRALVDAYLDFLGKKNIPALQDICYTAACRRSHHQERLAVTGNSHRELTDQLSSHREGEPAIKRIQLDEQSKVAFVFPGQGGQWLGMGRQMLEQNQIFQNVLERCDQSIRLWADWSLLEQLTLDQDSPDYRLEEISVIQPVLFAMQIALAAVWQSWGIEPAAVVGHSMGEVAAAYVAGALSLDEAIHVICKRSQLMQRTSGQGAMAVIGLPYAETQKLVDGLEDKLSIAVQNSPNSTVLSGDPEALRALMEKLQEQEIFCRLIKVDVASHSPQMDPLCLELVDSLQEIQPKAEEIPFYSTVSADIHEGVALDAEYWGRNLRQPVRFSTTIERMLEDEHVVFIEMNPHPILLSSIEEISSQVERPAYGFASLRRDQPELITMLGELGSLYMLGYPVDWNRLYPHGNVISLPAYPWQRERFWLEETPSEKQTRPGAHPLLGQYIRSATGEHIWETSIRTKQFPYLNDHQVRGSIVLPAAAYVEMVLAAVSEAFNAKRCKIQDISFREAFLIPTEGNRILQLVMTPSNADSAEFKFYSRTSQDEVDEEWILHTTGSLKFNSEAPSIPDLAQAQHHAQDSVQINSEDFYRTAASRGLEYGPSFQAVIQLSQFQQEILSGIKLPGDLLAQATKYLIHPVLIDACFQSLLAALPESNQDTYLPVHLASLQVHGTLDFSKELRAYAVYKTEADSITGDILLIDQDNCVVLSAFGLRMQRLKAKQGNIHEFLYEIQWAASPVVDHGQTGPGHWLIFSDQQGLGSSLAQKLQRDSHTCTLVFAGNKYRSIDTNSFEIDPRQSEHFQQLLREIDKTIYGILYLWSLDAQTEPSIQDDTLAGAFSLTQAVAQLDVAELPRLWLVTRGTQAVQSEPGPVSVSQASVWGMGAVIANELPALHCSRVDLSPLPMEGETDLLGQVLLAGGDEDQVALRNGQRYAARLKRSPLPAGHEAANVIRQKIDPEQPFRVQVITPGILDSLSPKPVLQRQPDAGQVEIAVKATGLNFMNVMGAMGIYPGYPDGVGPLGIECAGVITRLGKDVTDFQVGDEVTGIAFDCLASHAVTDARLLVKKPSKMSFEEAASIPIAYVTAYYALLELGRLRPGEHVLIHAATGGVGLAAIQLARRAGAKIFATAGSPEKREFLRSMGIEHIYDSRSLEFAEEILKDTNGEGMDLVLNSLAGDAIPKGLEILKPYGRFLEIGKRDIYENSKVGLLPFQKNLSYFAIDLDRMSRERPNVLAGILQQVFRLLEMGEVAALPVQNFPVSKANDAFRTMAQAKHIGKIAITMEDPEASFEIPAGSISVRADASYLITGGLGDLGLTFAQWLAGQGARHLVLLGRSMPSQAAQTVIDGLQAGGVNVTSVQADVTDIVQLAEVFLQIKSKLPPLRGIIHAAGLLADATLLQMDRDRFAQAWAPKAIGAWNLHELTIDQPLDFFILFSSAASILGLPGQANYAAGNAFLDGLARFRKDQNLAALSINWGPWSEIGLASTQANRGNRLAQQGLLSISPEQGLDAMSQIMARNSSQLSVMHLDAHRWCESQPAAARSSLFKEFLAQDSPEKNQKSSAVKSIRDQLLAAEPGRQRRLLLDAYIREQVAHVLHLPSARIQPDKPLKTLGMDSLMSIELRNRLEDGLGLSLPASLIWNQPTVNALVPFLGERLGIPLDEEKQPAAQRESAAKAQTPDLDELTRDELEALLAEELSAIDDSLKGNGFGTESRTGQ